MKKYSIALCILFPALLIGSSIVLHKKHTAQFSEMKSTIEQKLSETEDHIWQEFKRIGIDKHAVFEEFNKRVDSYYNNDMHEYKHLAPASEENQALIRSVLRELPLEYDNIYIFQKPEIHCAAYTSNNSIFINEDIFNTYAPDAKKFIITHETAHIFYKDSLLRLILRELCNAEGNVMQLASKSPNHPLVQYTRFTELRADIWANLQKKYIDGCIAYCQEALKHIPDGYRTMHTHPQYESRIKVAENIKLNKMPDIQIVV